jgi:hypothetical protein
MVGVLFMVDDFNYPKPRELGKLFFTAARRRKQKNVLFSDRVFPRLQSSENSGIPKNGDEADELRLARQSLFAKIRNTKQINHQ